MWKMGGFFSGDIDLHNVAGGDWDEWRVGSPLSYVTTAGDRLVVRPGATTDGASVPRLFWRLIPPFAGRHLAAAIVHDQLYATRGALGRFSREACDGIFREALRAAGVSRVQAWAMWAAVRAGGWAPWGRRSDAEAAKQMQFLEVWRAGA